MKLRKLTLVSIDHDHTENHLNENADLSERRKPPQGATAQCDNFVCAQRPDACECISNNHNPCPTRVQVGESCCVHDSLNLADKRVGFVAAVHE